MTADAGTTAETAAASDWSPLQPDADGTYAETFADLRGRCPVAWSEDFGGFWALTKHEDIVTACKKPGVFSSAPQFAVPHLDLGFPWLPLQSDAPQHGAYRGIVAPYLAKLRVQDLEPRLRELTRALLEPLAGRSGFDASVEFAQAIAGEALCLALHVPEDMWSEFRSWTSDIVSAFTNWDVPLILEVSAAVSDYVTREMKARSEDPGDDLMSAFLAAEVDGRKLTQTEIHGYYMLLTSAGHDTTANSLGHALHHLAENPDHAARLRADPSKVDLAVEEVVRFYGPLIGLGRQVTEDVEVRGKTIKAGQQVALIWAAAARDGDQVENAETFILDRTPARTVSFGFGAHYCVGADLGRLTLRVAIEEFLEAFPSFRSDGEVGRTMWPTQGIRTLPVAIG